MIKCFRSGIPNAMPTNLCQVRKMCLFLVIDDGFLSSIVRKAREALHLHPLILVSIGENCNGKNAYHYLDSSFLLNGHPLWPVQRSHPKRVTSVVYISTMYMLHMNVVLVSAKNGHKCLLLRT